MAGLIMANGTVAFLVGAAGAIATIASQMGGEAVQFNSKEEVQEFFNIWYDTVFFPQLQRPDADNMIFVLYETDTYATVPVYRYEYAPGWGHVPFRIQVGTELDYGTIEQAEFTLYAVSR
ncbi:hypothetical protein [Thermogemmatispora onikobensis]|nr:hypothetical protein [Thermogemmatispora onikobensis]